MKNMLKSLLSVAAAALALTSCSNDATEEVTIKGKPKTLEVNATIDQTRTTMESDHVHLAWSEGDKVHLYVGANATEDEVIHHVIGKEIATLYEDGDNVYAYYSTEAGSGSDGVRNVLLNIPSTQTQEAADVFAGENLPMAAKGVIEGGKVTLQFKPLGCVLVFNVYNNGQAMDEKIESIKFDTTVGCCGYNGNNGCDLTADEVQYKAYEKGTSATVTLTKAAAVGASKPENTQIGNKNQVYLVVAPVSYPEGSKFTITTESKKTYTFTTKNGIDCSQKSARVVNINLANAAEMQPAIEVPIVPQQSSDTHQLEINGIVFKNITEDQIRNATVGIYRDAALSQLGASWLMFEGTPTEALLNGQLNCTVWENATTESRTGYIGIRCAGAKAVIPVTQVAKGASTDKYFVKVTENPADGDWEGTYLIVCEGENKALNGNLGADELKVAHNNIIIEITGQGILSNDTTNSAVVIITKKKNSTDEYMLQTASGCYLYASSDNSMLSATKTYNTAAKYKQYISIENDCAKITCSGAVMRFNTAANADCFKYYKSDSYTNQKPVQLYKLQE